MVKFSDLKYTDVKPARRVGLTEVGLEPSNSSIRFRTLSTGTESSELLEDPLGTSVAPDKAETNGEDLYQDAYEYLEGVFQAVRNQNSFDPDRGFEIVREMVEIQAHHDTLFLNAIYMEDPHDYVVRHSVNLAVFSILLAEDLGYNAERRIEIGMVALFHEVGAALVSDKLLYKKGSLTRSEYETLRKRPRYGYEILFRFKDKYPYLAECALQIYERIDGSGYPRGLKDDEIHEYSQIVGLVAIYEALIHSRPQREKFLHFNAVKEIIKTGKGKFQSKYLKGLLNIFSVFPLQSYVRLNSRAIGQVVETFTDQPMRPKIRILYDSQKRKVLIDRIVNLTENPLLYIEDSVSEDELLSLSETSDFLEKPPSDGAEYVDGFSMSDTRQFLISDIGADNGENDRSIHPGHRARKYPAVSSVVAIGLLVCLGFALVWQMRSGDWVSTSDVKRGEPQAVKVPIDYPPNSLKIREPEPHETGRMVSSRQKGASGGRMAAEVDTEGTENGKIEDRASGYRMTGKTENSGQAGAFDGRLSEETGTSPAVIATSDMVVSKAENLQAKEEDGGQTSVSTAERLISQPSDRVPDAMASDISSPAIVDVLPETGVAGIESVLDANPHRTAFPYSVKLTYFKTREEAEESLAGFREKGLFPYCVRVGLGGEGIWHRVFTGHFETREQAREFIKKHKLNGVAVKHTRFAVLIGTFSAKTQADVKTHSIQQSGYSAYVIQRESEQFCVYVGAFYTQKGAEDQFAALNADGIEGRIVER